MDVKLPQLVDYRDAVAHPEHSFVDEDLRRAGVRKTPQGVPAVSSGGFALTFDITTHAGNRLAVRCFHKTGNHLQERYAEIAEFVRTHRGDMDFLVDVAYQGQGIRVNGTAFPIVRMQWVEGARLDYWVEDHLNQPDALDGVRWQLGRATAMLRAAGAAHGDLQHGNVLVNRGGQVRLVDYDGLFLPALAPLGAAELGHRSYQHPDRGNSYHRDLDFFSAYVINLSLKAIKQDPSLWQEFYTGENLLFAAADFAEPERSALFARLFRTPSLAREARLLAHACSAEFAAVPTILSGERIAVPVQPAKTGNRRLVSGPDVVSAGDRSAMIARSGDQVTAVGRITSVKQPPARSGAAVSLINFGDYRRGDFTIVAFGPASQALRRAYGNNLDALKGRWVSITGLVTPYQSKYAKDVTPQIELKRVSSLRVLDEAQAKAMFKPPPPSPPTPTPTASSPELGVELGLGLGSARGDSSTSTSGVYRWSAPPKPQPDDLDARLSDLFAKPGFTTTPKAPSPAAPVPPAPPPPSPAPPTQQQPVWPPPTPQQSAWQPPVPPQYPGAHDPSTIPNRRWLGAQPQPPQPLSFWQRLKRSFGL
ncbi:hypothetical protein ACQPW3_05805 [Actinosynnema sp. CA-248983]